MNEFITKMRNYRIDDCWVTAISFTVSMTLLTFLCAFCVAGMGGTENNVSWLPLLSVIILISGLVFLRNFGRM